MYCQYLKIGDKFKRQKANYLSKVVQSEVFPKTLRKFNLMLLENALTAEDIASAASSVARVYSMSVNDESCLLLACDFFSKLLLTYI